MYPYKIIWDIDLYDIFLTVGFNSALIVFDIYTTKRKMKSKIQTFYLILGIVSIFVGLYSAELFQSVFNYIKTGEFKFQGLTFYGGLIGGTIIFLTGFFLVGKFIFKDKEHISSFKELLEVAPCCITVAHAFGRLGCLTAGCCYGLETDGFPGFHMHVQTNSGYVEGTFLPTQLYESLFLFGLFVFLSVRYFKGKPRNLSVYLIAYGLWRFFMEFLRIDERGAFLPFLTPAQAISILAVILGIILIFIFSKSEKNSKKAP